MLIQLLIDDPGTNTVLIMTSSVRTADLLREYLDSMEADKPAGEQGTRMMRMKLRAYLAKQAMRKSGKGNNAEVSSGNNAAHEDAVNAALRKKDKERQAKSANRRRMRGGAPVTQPSRDAQVDSTAVRPEP